MPAALLSRMCSGFAVPGMAQFSAGWPTIHHRRMSSASRSRLATPDYAPTPKRMTGLLIVIGITIIALAVWFLMRLGTFAPQAG